MQAHEQRHAALVRTLSPECTLLLKSNGDFPLSAPCTVALYGSGARKTLKGGTGSGDVNVRSYPSAEQGLLNAGFTVTSTPWLDGYDRVREEARKQFLKDLRAEARRKFTVAILIGMGRVMPEPAYDLPMDYEAEAGVYVLSRICGEGSDRRAIPGDMQLTETEVRDIHRCAKKYKKFMLVLNVGAVVDLTPVMDVENILLLSQLGSAVGDVLSDLLLGKAYPSGKLTATWAAAEEYSREGSFAEVNDTVYTEGVFVGYRYFDTLGKTPLFPFGYGLGYTTFELNSRAALRGTEVTVTADVKNTGSHAGKETVQVYVSCPVGKLSQPCQKLAAFKKTSELLPGQQETVTLTFDLRSLASFDEDTAAEILEAGAYILRVGTHSRNTVPVAAVALDGTAAVRQLTHVGGSSSIPAFAPACPREELTGIPELRIAAAEIPAYEALPYGAPSAEALALSKTLSDEQLADLTIGLHVDGPTFMSVIGSAGQDVAGSAGQTSRGLKDLPSLVMADGPAGLRLSTEYYVDKKGRAVGLGASMPADMFDLLPAIVKPFLAGTPKAKGEVKEQYCTAIPIGTAIAQSWNIDLAEALGDMVGEEMELFNIDLWLAPAFNIHRSPLCGRNFEYYSEDPLLSGKFGAAISRGVQKHPGKGVTVKHFCCNNQETNRYASNSVMSERTLREIYLKPFEICIREGAPLALMTSYNLLNGTHTSERRDLMETVIRGEWGYTGLIMTDWVVPGMASGKTAYRTARAAETVAAGNELFMPGNSGNYKDVLSAVKGTHPTVRITRQELEIRAAYVIDAARRNPR